MSMIGNQPGVSSQRTVLEEVISGSSKSNFVPQGGYVIGYVDVLVNGHELDSSDFTAPDGININLAVAAAVGDTVKVKAWLPRGLSDGYTKAEADSKYVTKTSASGTTTIDATAATWWANGKQLQLGAGTALWDYNATGNNQTRLLNNLYLDSTAAARYLNTNNAAYYQMFNGAHTWGKAPSGTAGALATLTDTMILDANGRLKILTSAGQMAPATTTDITSTAILSMTAGGGDGLTIGQYAGSRIWMQSSYLANPSLGYYDLVLQPLGGNVVVGIANPTNLWAGTGSGNGSNFSAAYSAIQCSTNTNLYLSKAAGFTSGGLMEFYVNGGAKGSIYTNGTSVTFNTSSDYRLKDIDGPMVGALARNALLQPKIGTWKEDGSPFEGFLAHELQAVFAHAAHGQKDAVDADGKPIYQSVGTGPLDAHFAACINELQELIAAQAAEIATLKGA